MSNSEYDTPSLGDELNDRSDFNKIRNFTVLNTNARSLCPKIRSLTETMEESVASMAIVTETWFRDGEGLEEGMDDLSEGEGLGLLCRNRPLSEAGLAHGGVAILYKKSVMNLKELDIRSADNFEVLTAIGILKDCQEN